MKEEEEQTKPEGPAQERTLLDAYKDAEGYATLLACAVDPSAMGRLEGVPLWNHALIILERTPRQNTLATCGGEARRNPYPTTPPSAEPIPATPAPSQLAGALPSFSKCREQNYENQWAFGWWKIQKPHNRPTLLDEVENAYAEAYAAQQTAAFELKGWQDAINSIRASLQQYPNAGGDIEIMQAVEKIVKEQTAAKDVDVQRYKETAENYAEHIQALDRDLKAAERERDSLRAERDGMVRELGRNAANVTDGVEVARLVMLEVTESRRESAALKSGKDGQQ